MAETIISFDTGHTGAIHHTALDYYGKKLATASADGCIKIFNTGVDETGKGFAEMSADINAHDGPVWHLSWAHPKFVGLLASAGYDKSISIWKEQSEGMWGVVHKDANHRASVNCVAFAPMELGLICAGGSSDGTISLLMYVTPGDQWQRTQFSAHAAGVLCFAWEEQPNIGPTGGLDGARIVSGGCDNSVRIWRYAMQTQTWVNEDIDFATDVKGHRDWVTGVSWRPFNGSSDCVASCSKDGSVILWEKRTGDSFWKPVKQIAFDDKVWSVQFAEVGGMLLVSYGDNKTTVLKEDSTGEYRDFIFVDAFKGSDKNSPREEFNLSRDRTTVYHPQNH